MEWELIEFILDVYLMLVIGEGRFPVNSNPNGPPDAMNTPVSNNNNPNMTMSLAPIQVHQARSDWPKQILLSLAGMSPAKLETFEVSLQKILVGTAKYLSSLRAVNSCLCNYVCMLFSQRRKGEG